MVYQGNTAPERSLSTVDSDEGSVCSLECQPPGLVPDLVNTKGVNLDGCNDTHVGPRINFNIVLNGNEVDTKRALRPINRILDEKLLSAPYLYQKPTLGEVGDEKLGAVPSAPYEESLPETIEDLKPPFKKGRSKPSRTCVLVTSAAVLLVGAGLTVGIYASVKLYHRHNTSPTNSSSPSPPTVTPSSPTPQPSNPTQTPSTPATTVSVTVETFSPTLTNPTPTPSPFAPSHTTARVSELTIFPEPWTEPWPDFPSTPKETVPTCQYYEHWGQNEPETKYQRSGQSMFDTVALDNLPGERCAKYEDCVYILKKAESGESLNYNFLIDDSGNLYYARGTKWEANMKFNVARVAFIGSYNGLTDAHLTENQIQMLSTLLTGDPGKFTIDADVDVEAQCIQNIEGQSGPDKNVICDVEAKLGVLVETVNTTGNNMCSWRSKLVCHS